MGNPGKGTKFKLLSIINKVLLHLALTLLFGLMSQETLSVRLNHTEVPRHLLLLYHHTCGHVAYSNWIVSPPVPTLPLSLPPINCPFILPEAQP